MVASLEAAQQAAWAERQALVASKPSPAPGGGRPSAELIAAMQSHGAAIKALDARAYPVCAIKALGPIVRESDHIPPITAPSLSGREGLARVTLPAFASCGSLRAKGTLVTLV
eukprot:SAG11_NODE_2714_length_3052_cov_1.918727_1_plen_113_part_00